MPIYRDELVLYNGLKSKTTRVRLPAWSPRSGKPRKRSWPGLGSFCVGRMNYWDGRARCAPLRSHH